MRRAVSILCVLLVIPLLLLFLHIHAALPNDTAPLVQEKYASWSGVLRLWVYEGWEANAITWLNRAISSFEKAYSGVYIQARKVDAEALRSFCTSGVNPPDMILFPPGLLESADGLAPLDEPPALREGLAACGGGYAVPVLMGGYAWAYDRQALDSPPQEAGDATLACAPAGEYSSLPAALMLLLTGEQGAEIELEAPGLDLGLPVSVDRDEAQPSTLPALSEDAYAAFSRGEVDALPVSQAQIRRLKALSEAGRGPDWTAAATGEAMLADQLLLLGIVDWPRDDLEARQELCRAFLAHLLSVETQTSLTVAGALPVLEGLTLYAGESGYEALEAAASLPLLVPPVFGTSGRETLDAVAGAFWSGQISAGVGIERLRATFAR